MRDNNAVQAQLGRNEGNLRAARAYLYATAKSLARCRRGGERIAEQHRMALRLASTWTIHQAAAWSTPPITWPARRRCFSRQQFERRFRDMHAIAQQLQGRDTHYETPAVDPGQRSGCGGEGALRTSWTSFS